MTNNSTVPQAARILGFFGLVPQLVTLFVVISDHDRYTYAAQALAFAYAALIVSFLGGIWWGLAAKTPTPPGWLWVAAIFPSLFAFASFLPWAFGGAWPGPSLIMLGSGLLASLLVDLQLARVGLAPRWWMALRVPLSLGLGLSTLGIGFLA